MATTQIDGGRQIKSATITTTQLSASAGITDGQLATSYIKTDGTRAFTGEVGGVTPTSSNSLATKGYVDGVAAGVDWKASVRVATTAAGTLASSFENGDSVDGVTLATNDRILIKDQSTGSENGIYTVNASGAPTRATDADANSEVTGGLAVFVEEGTTNADSGWILTNNGAITLGSTALVFTQFTGLGQITVGGGGSIVKTGNQLTRGALTGDVTASADSNATTIANGVVSLAKMANLAANSVIANNTGSSATPTALGLTAAATASTAMLRDTNANTKVNSLATNIRTTATAAGTTTLVVGDAQFQQFTGSTTQTVVLPDATTLVLGQSYVISNQSSGTVTINANGGGAVRTLTANTMATVTLIAAGSAAGTWDPGTTATATGTVTSVSVVSANGFNGSVATATSTPAITLTTTVTGVLKGNGTAISAATAGSDYLAPSSRVTRETPSGTVNGSNTAFTLANTPIAGTEEVYLNGVQQEPGAGNDYTISGTAITYLSAPLTGDKIRVSYFK